MDLERRIQVLLHHWRRFASLLDVVLDRGTALQVAIVWPALEVCTHHVPVEPFYRRGRIRIR